MNTTKQASWLFVLLIVLAVSGWYFAAQPMSHTLDDRSLATIPDVIITKLKVTQFDGKGQLANRLDTDKLKHMPKGDVKSFRCTQIIVAEADHPAWNIQSEKAKAVKGGESTIFTQKVVIHQNKGTNTQESTLRTEEITYFPKTKKAMTPLSVTFEQPGTVVHSIGMNAYLDEKKVELLKGVQGQYAPAKARG